MVIHCEERLREAREYAAQLGDHSLQKCLDRLESWERDGRTVHLCVGITPLIPLVSDWWLRTDG